MSYNTNLYSTCIFHFWLVICYQRICGIVQFFYAIANWKQWLAKTKLSCRHFTKIRVEHEFNLKTIPIERPIKGFENISECYEIIDKK